MYLKGRLGADGVALMAAFKSWFQPSLTLAGVVERSFDTGKTRTGVTIQASDGCWGRGNVTAVQTQQQSMQGLPLPALGARGSWPVAVCILLMSSTRGMLNRQARSEWPSTHARKCMCYLALPIPG